MKGKSRKNFTSAGGQSLFPVSWLPAPVAISPSLEPESAFSAMPISNQLLFDSHTHFLIGAELLPLSAYSVSHWQMLFISGFIVKSVLGYFVYRFIGALKQIAGLASLPTRVRRLESRRVSWHDAH